METVAILLSNTGIQYIVVDKKHDQYVVQAYEHTPCTAPLANPTQLQRTITQFLTKHNCQDAPVTLAVDLPTTRHHISGEHETTPPGYAWRCQKLNEDGPEFLYGGIERPTVAQCQLLAINTPFYCAGITTHHLAQLAAARQLTDAYPPVTDNVAQYLHELSATIDTTVVQHNSQLPVQDQLCVMGMQSLLKG